MIVRVWHGRTLSSKAKEYHDFILQKGIGDYKKTPGNVDAFLVQQQEGGVTHIWTVSHWKDLKSIESFAGADLVKAKYYKEDRNYLLEFEPTVHHHETSHAVIHDLILKDIIQLYSGGGWYGECFCDKVSDLNEETSFKRPLGKFHSVAEILWHCTYWRKLVVERLKGNFSSSASMERENWLPVSVLKAKGWENLLSLFQQSQIELVGQFLKTSEEFLNTEYKSGYTLQYLTEGIKHHDIYHLGQIGLVKRMTA